MKNFLLSFSLYLFLLSGTFASHEATVSQSPYYVGDVIECRYMEYTCEHGYQKFSDAKGCGCMKSTIDTNQYYVPQNTYNSSRSYYDTRDYSVTNNLSYCRQGDREVCGAPKNTCSWSNCPILHPRTYMNTCQMQAVDARYLYDWECQTHSRANYNTYGSNYYRNDYYSSDEDYLMYLVNEFIYKLERKNYSDSKMITTIDRVIERLEDLWDSNSRYRSASREAIRELDDYRDRLEDDDAYDKIENIFDRY